MSESYNRKVTMKPWSYTSLPSSPNKAGRGTQVILSLIKSCEWCKVWYEKWHSQTNVKSVKKLRLLWVTRTWLVLLFEKTLLNSSYRLWQVSSIIGDPFRTTGSNKDPRSWLTTRTKGIFSDEKWGAQTLNSQISDIYRCMIIVLEHFFHTYHNSITISGGR